MLRVLPVAHACALCSTGLIRYTFFSFFGTVFLGQVKDVLRGYF